MQIEIPQYISAEVGYDRGKRLAFVYIGNALVYTEDTSDYGQRDWTDEELKMCAVTAFGKMLALKIGD